MMDVFDLKKRAYIGNTSMESEVSLLMANQALAKEGKLVYDPFGELSPPLSLAPRVGKKTKLILICLSVFLSWSSWDGLVAAYELGIWSVDVRERY